MAARNFRIVYLMAAGAVVLSCCGCAYRMYAPNPSSQEHVKIVAKFPDLYALQMEERATTVGKSADRNAFHTDAAHVANYQVPSDGRVTIGIPSFRPNCGVYLFNWIKVGGGGNDTLKTWNVSIVYGSRTLRRLSLKNVRELPTDVDGYRLLKIPD
jgi:hypothetical protein